MVIMAKDGGCRGRGRIGDSKPGYHNLMLMLVVVGVLRNAVPDDCYPNGYEAVSPRRRGDLADVRAPSKTSQKLLAKGAPGLSRGEPLNPREAVTRCPVATRAALEWQEGSLSNMTMPSGRARAAGTVWPVTCLGSGPGMFTTMAMLPQ